jgi:hypothetical protein
MALKLEETELPLAAAPIVARPHRRLLAYNLAFALTAALLLALMGGSYLFLTRTGDTIPPSQAAARQESENVLFGSALYFRPVPYKLALYRLRKPDVAIVGSSRAIEFVRHGFTSSMVNMGSMRDMAQIRSLLQAMFAAHRPQLVILTIDFWWFNSARSEEVVDLQPDTAVIGVSVHGVGASGSMVTVDGLVTNGTMGDGAVMAYHNEAMIQELVYQTAGGTAETITGGVNMNFVPKDGGNRFAGALKYAKSPKQWQGDNLTDRLHNLGVSAVDKIDNFYEVNIEEGGPIIKDKLWFFGAFRRAHYDKPIANTWDLPTNLAPTVAFAQCKSGAISCSQGISDEKMDNPIARFTWQMSPRNKFAAYMDRAMRLRGHAMAANTDPATGSVVWHTPTFSTGSAKWTSTVSSKLLEALFHWHSVLD